MEENGIFSENDKFFNTNLQAIVGEIMKILKYVVKIEVAPDYIIPKINIALDNLSEILTESRKILEEIQEKKQQVLDYLHNSQSYKDSMQTFEALIQAYKQKCRDQENKILGLEQEKKIFEARITDFERIYKRKNLI